MRNRYQRTHARTHLVELAEIDGGSEFEGVTLADTVGDGEIDTDAPPERDGVGVGGDDAVFDDDAVDECEDVALLVPVTVGVGVDVAGAPITVM